MIFSQALSFVNVKGAVMQRKISIPLLTTALMGLLICGGCAGYGQARYQGLVQGRDMLESMMANFEDYHVYYSGMSESFPSGIIFDPKDDEKTVVQNGWIPVETRDLAWELVRNLERFYHFRPVLYALIGEDGRHYGYIYTSYQRIVVRQLEENKIYVNEMPIAPHLKYEQNGSLRGFH